MDDLQIIELFWLRDEAAILESQKKYGDFCRSIAFHILNDPEDTKECVLDTWLRAWDSIPPTRPNFLRAFFGRIVRNLSISRYRREHAQKRFSSMEILLGELEDCIPSVQTTETMAEASELSRIIETWLLSLPREARILFLRRYWNGLPLKTLAKELGISANNLSQRMYRLRLSLKTALEKEGYQP